MEVFVRTKWAIDPFNSHIGFKIKHLRFLSISGKFKEFDANIYTKGNDFLTAQIDCWVNPASLDTGDTQRDLLLKSADFFNVEEFKVINFCGKNSAVAKHGNHFRITGDLVMKGIAREIELDVEFAGLVEDIIGNEKSLCHIKGQINRSHWGLNWNTKLEYVDQWLSEDVSIECDIQLIKQP